MSEPSVRKPNRDWHIHAPQNRRQTLWLVICGGWVVFAIFLVIGATIEHASSLDDAHFFAGQIIFAAPASWIGLIPLIFLPQKPFGPDGGGGVEYGWFIATQVLTCVLVVVQGWLVYLLGPRPKRDLSRVESG